jgi:CDP-diacylglycerol--glycerol-3-phosphate 3-phosphatidyltransferase
MMQWTIPNILSLFRIVAAPFLMLSGWLQMPTLFFILFGAMLLSDALDGFLARLLSQTSHLGARLDSYGDILTYLATLFSVWWLWPDIIQSELNYIIAAAIFTSVQALVSLIKFGKLASYHTWITKLSAVMVSLGIIILLVFKETSLFHLAVYILAIEMFENVAITLLIKEQKDNIHSLYHALKERR